MQNWTFWPKFIAIALFIFPIISFLFKFKKISEKRFVTYFPQVSKLYCVNFSKDRIESNAIGSKSGNNFKKRTKQGIFYKFKIEKLNFTTCHIVVKKMCQRKIVTWPLEFNIFYVYKNQRYWNFELFEILSSLIAFFFFF